MKLPKKIYVCRHSDIGEYGLNCGQRLKNKICNNDGKPCRQTVYVREKTCAWSKIGLKYSMTAPTKTQCRHTISYGQLDVSMKFCPYCGGRIKEKGLKR